MKFAVKEKNYPPYHPPRVFKNSKYCMFNETRHVALVGGQSMAARPAAAAAVAPVFSSAVRHKIGSSSCPAPLQQQQPTNQMILSVLGLRSISTTRKCKVSVHMCLFRTHIHIHTHTCVIDGCARDRLQELNQFLGAYESS